MNDYEIKFIAKTIVELWYFAIIDLVATGIFLTGVRMAKYFYVRQQTKNN